MFTTFQDAVELLMDYVGAGGGVDARTVRDCKRAATEAYRDLANAFRWTYLYTHGRVITSAPFASGAASSLTYQATGGTYDNMLTLSGDVWPAWAADGYIRIAPDGSSAGDVAYRVAERKSATVLTLEPSLSPAADIATPAAFTLYQDTYLLPPDFIAQDQAMYERNFGGMDYTHPREWLYENRYVFAQGVPQCYTITGDPKYPGRLVMRIFPWPTDARTIDFVYHRRPREIAIAQVTGGTASIASGGHSATLTLGVATPSMVGSIIRLGASADTPTGEVGDNPAEFESIISAWVSPTQVTTLDPSPADLAAVGYAISDPVDVERGSMVNAFFRCCEMHIGMNRTLKDKPSARGQYLEALGRAKDADSRSFAGRSAGPQSRIRPRLRDMPVGPDQP